MTSPLRRVARVSCFLLALAVHLRVVRRHRERRRRVRVRGAIGAGLRGPSGLTATVYAKGLKHIVRARDRRAGSGLGCDRGGERQGQGRDLPRRRGRRDAAEGRDRRAHAARARLDRRHALRVAGRQRARARRLRRHAPSRRAPPSSRSPTAPVRSTASPWASDGRLYVGISAPCNSCTPTEAVLGVDRVLPPRRQRPPGVRPRHPRRHRARVLPRHRRPLRHHEPARRPRRRRRPATGSRSCRPASRGDSHRATGRTPRSARRCRHRSPSSTSTRR